MTLSPKLYWIACIGTIFEMYDFTLYSLMASTLATVFFPFSPHNGIFYAYGILAVGYAARPIGAMLAGNFGDLMGRKAMLLITISAMAAPSLFIIGLPGYAHAGISSAIILMVLRTMQGLAVGGEFSGSVVFIGEFSTDRDRTKNTAMIIMSINIGVLLAMAVSYVVFHSLTPTDVLAWGWRSAYFLGGIIALIGVYLRFKAVETPDFLALKEQQALARIPMMALLKQHFSAVMRGLLLMLSVSAMLGVLLVFLPNYLTRFYPGNHAHAIFLSIIFVVLLCVAIVVGGYLSLRWDKRFMFRVGLMSLIVCSWPLFYVLSLGALWLTIAALFVLAVMASLLLSTFSSILFDLFPANVRYSGMSTTYNIPIGIITGLTPLLVVILMRDYHSFLAPAWYIIGFSLLSLCGELL